MALKARIQEAAEKVYDIIKDDKYDVEMKLTTKGKGVKVKTNRNTQHNKKWGAKIH
ncbi:hypothetical protein [Enterococcus sp. HY326]|uniref:hypothetical protein n=1 Tax=Enterococcus sp. HY326 TaxID=2971265 RepID=UPI00223F7B5B|nr:hypothetical protein [Enterococcus sp. HY326]